MMELKFNNELFNIETQVKEDRLISKINDENNEFLYRKLNNNTYKFFVNDKYIPAYVAEDENHIYVALDGDNYIFDKISDDDFTFDSDDSNSSDIDNIKPPMPGSVVKVLVEEGQNVNDGDPVIIVEAMKMESTLYSSITGVVAEVNAKQGEQVDSTQNLIVIKKIEE